MIPSYLLLENFMSHARSELDFTQFEMGLVIGSDNDNPDVSNGIGKTALFDAMLWAIYGKCRFSSKKKVIKHGKASCGVTFMFDLDGLVYKILRRASSRTASNEVQLLIKEGQKWRDLSRDTPTGTSAKIQETIGMNYDTFINSVYFRQFDVSRFASATATQKKAILKEILHIGAWDKYQDTAKGRMKKLAGQLEILDDRIKALGDLDKLRQDNQLALETARLALKDSRANMGKKEQSLDAVKEKLADCEALAKSPGNLLARKKLLDEREAVVTERREHLNQSVSNNNAKMDETGREAPKLKKTLLSSCCAILILSEHKDRRKAAELYLKVGGKKAPDPTIDRKQARLDEVEGRKCDEFITGLKLQIEQMNALEPGEKCPCCLTEIKDLKTVVSRRDKKRKFLEGQLKDKEVLAKLFHASQACYSEVVGESLGAALNMKQADEALRKAIEDRITAKKANELCKEEFGLLAQEWSKIQEEKKTLAGADDAETLYREIKEAQKTAEARKEALTQARKKVMDLGVEFGNLEGRAEDLKRRFSERDTLLVKKPNLVKEHAVHKKLVKAFSKDGVPAIIMENVTEDLRNYANEVLRTICNEPMTIDFVTQNRTEAGSWVETFDITVSGGDRTNDEFRDLSGGEQVRISIALRLALSKILMRRVGSNIKFLLLDEVDQALDRQGIQSLAETLRALSRKFKVLVITHNDSMKDMFDHIITVRKGAAGSTVQQVAA